MTPEPKAPSEIFIVDDEPAVLDALSVVLSLEGYQVSAFRDSASFLASARQRTPDGARQREPAVQIRTPDQFSFRRQHLARHVPTTFVATFGVGRLLQRVEHQIVAPLETRLAGSIESLEFKCYTGSDWRDLWDTTTGETNLPVAVLVRLLPASEAGSPRNPKPIEMLVPLTVQPFTNSTAGGAP